MWTSVPKACLRATRSARNASTFSADISADVDAAFGRRTTQPSRRSHLPATPSVVRRRGRGGAAWTWTSARGGAAAIAVRPAPSAATRSAPTTAHAPTTTTNAAMTSSVSNAHRRLPVELRWSQLRFQFDSMAVGRLFHCLRKVIKVTVT